MFYGCKVTHFSNTMQAL